jgi:integrase/recombinase XerD
VRRGIRGQAVTLRGLWIHPRDGTPFYRSRKGGQTVLVRLPEGLPFDHPDFVTAWARAAGAGRSDPPPAPVGTIASLWRAALDSREAAEWSTSFRGTISRHAAAICAARGKLPARGIRDRHIEKDVAEAVDPLARHKAWRFWGKWGKRHCYLASDPAESIARPKIKPTEGYPPWFEPDIAAFRARHAIGTVPRAAMELMHFAGCRVSDAVLIGPQHIGRDGVLAYRQRKTGQMAYCPWSCTLPPFAAHLEADRAMMMQALAPFGGHLTFLATQAGRTRSDKGLTTLMGAACNDAGIAQSSHGLRKWRAIDLVEHGATSPQTGAWTGHHTLAEIERYIRARDRRNAVIGTSAEPAVETRAPRLETGR